MTWHAATRRARAWGVTVTRCYTPPRSATWASALGSSSRCCAYRYSPVLLAIHDCALGISPVTSYSGVNTQLAARVPLMVSCSSSCLCPVLYSQVPLDSNIRHLLGLLFRYHIERSLRGCRTLLVSTGLPLRLFVTIVARAGHQRQPHCRHNCS